MLLVIAALLASPIALAQDAGTADYAKGFLIKSADGNNALHIQTRMDFRYTLEQELTGTSPDPLDEASFDLKRARISMGGHVFGDDIRYKIQLAWDHGAPGLKDFYFDLGPKKGWQWRVGQFKTPFSREQINSSGKLALVDRAITDKAFLAGRDLGFMLHNGVEESSGFQGALGVFNGSTDKAVFEGSGVADLTTGEVEIDSGSFSNEVGLSHPEVVMRVAYSSEDLKGYDEIDWDGGALRAGVGLSGVADFDLDGGDDGRTRAELDGMVRVEGFTFTGDVYIMTSQDDVDWGNQAVSATGTQGQVNYLVGKVAPALRYARVFVDGEGNDTTEILAGVGYYQHKHDAKLTLDGGMVVEETAADPVNTIVGRAQMQLAF